MGPQVLTTIVDTSSADAEQGQVCVFPASLEQCRYWILDQLDLASTASNMAIAFRLEGTVDDALIERSIRELVLRHEALRTSFRMVDGELSQVISDEPRFALSISDLRSLPPCRSHGSGRNTDPGAWACSYRLGRRPRSVCASDPCHG